MSFSQNCTSEVTFVRLARTVRIITTTRPNVKLLNCCECSVKMVFGEIIWEAITITHRMVAYQWPINSARLFLSMKVN